MDGRLKEVIQRSKDREVKYVCSQPCKPHEKLLSPKVLTLLPGAEDRPSGLKASEVLKVVLSERYHCGPDLNCRYASAEGSAQGLS